MNTYVLNTVQINLLIVDDKPEHQLMLIGYLNNIDCNIITAKSSQEALDYLQHYEFALLILDLEMFAIDRLTSTAIPIIFMAGKTFDQGSLCQGHELGVVDFLTKPIEPVILRNKVRIFLALYQQQKLLSQQAELLESNAEELLKLKAVNNQLETLSTLDGLTGIPNRRHFDQAIERYWKTALREQLPLSLLMIDIDNFKAYNDTYGHVKGDDCLILVAKTLASSVKRPDDFVARYGGEEFCVVLPNTDKKGAFHVAETMRKSIEMLTLKQHHSHVDECVTISLGIAEIIPKPFDSIANFINNADSALYLAKQLGRNKVYMENLSKIKANKAALQKKILYRSFRETISGLWLS
ncbi:MAG: diguanylate cyclase [Desulfosporosinus sp.]|nr:diguanylate cyclase [Desulfosporosinus sp.]